MLFGADEEKFYFPNHIWTHSLHNHDSSILEDAVIHFHSH